MSEFNVNKDQQDAAALPRLVVVGATGNTGLETMRLLMRTQPHRKILALIRQTTDPAPLAVLGIETHICDLEKAETYLPLLDAKDIFLEMANLRYARRMLPYLHQSGLTRAFCVTTTGVFSKHHSYSALYREIEQEMRNSPMEVTILRPSMIYGNEKDHNMHKLLRFINRSPIFPVFGDGKAMMQPVHVEDLASGILRAILNDAVGEYNLAGPNALSYRQLIDEAYRALNKKGIMVFIPTAPIASLIGLLQHIPVFPVKREQVIRLQEDKIFDITASQRELSYRPRPFDVGIAQEVELLHKQGIL